MRYFLLGIIIFFFNFSIPLQAENVTLPPFAPSPAMVCHGDVMTILSVDGGGVRGIIPAVFLDKLEQQAHKPIADMFDLMTGVSTGSIIVSMLAIPNAENKPRYTAHEVVSMYENNADDIFSASFVHQVLTLGGMIGPKYSSDGISGLGKKYFGDYTLAQLMTPVVLFGYDTYTKGVVPFCNWSHCGPLGQDYKVRDLIEGTTAVMSLFPAKVLIDSEKKTTHQIIDAALILNNPTTMSFIYAHDLCPNAKHYLFVSIGTGRYPGLDHHDTGEWGFLDWLPRILDLTVTGEAATTNIVMAKIANLLNNNSSEKFPRLLFIRVNPGLSWDRMSPVDVNLQHLLNLKLYAEEDYVKNQAIFTCLAQVLVTQSYQKTTPECLKTLELASLALFQEADTQSYQGLVTKKNNYFTISKGNILQK